MTTVTTAAQPESWYSGFGWQPYPDPSRRGGPTGTLPAAPESVIVGQMLSKASAYPIRSRTSPRKESPISKIHRTVVRNERYRKNAISVRERHNERKNEVYSNPDVLLE